MWPGDDQLQHDERQAEPEEDEREVGVDQPVQEREPGAIEPLGRW